MFILESTYDGAGTIPETAGITDSEAGAVGEVMKFSSGKLTKAGADDAPEAVLIKATGAGTGVTTEFIRVRRDQVFVADYTGTAPVVGAAYGHDSTALLIDGDNTSGGEWIVKSVDTTKTKCRVMANL
jgi:hypothetical protein